MEAQAWTAIALLAATLISSLFYLGSRIDGLAGRMDSLGSRLDSRIDGLTGRIDGLAGGIDALGARSDSRIDGLTAEVRAQNARMGRLEDRAG